MQAKKYDNKETFMEYSFYLIYMYYVKKRHTALHIISFYLMESFEFFLMKSSGLKYNLVSCAFEENFCCCCE